MNDDPRREAIARVLHDMTPCTVGWEGHRHPATNEPWLAKADAVLAVLPPEGWEQVGDWVVHRMGHSSPWPHHYDERWCVAGGCVPVYRRVDGAAPPEEVRIPKDPEARAKLAQFAGLTDEERLALDQWCDMQATADDDARRRGLERLAREDAAPPEPPTYACDDCGWTWPLGEITLESECDACGGELIVQPVAPPEPERPAAGAWTVKFGGVRYETRQAHHEPERCPTCASTDPKVCREGFRPNKPSIRPPHVWEDDGACCSDPFHAVPEGDE